MNRLLPEWAAVNSVILAWPMAQSDWDDNLEDACACYWNILMSILATSNVTVLIHPSIDRTQWMARYDAQKTMRAVPVKNLTLINHVSYNDTWTRDYAPLSTQNFHLSFEFNGWGGKYAHQKDDAVAAQLKSTFIKPVKKRAFVLEGGAVEINDDGLLLANKNCVVNPNRNDWTLEKVELYLSQALGVSHFAWVDVLPLSGDDTDGHIDTIARFANNKTVVYCGENNAHPDREILHSLRSQLSILGAQHDLTMVPLPTPVVHSQLLPTQLLPATYANFLICNDCVFMPIYGLKSDQAALEILQSVFALKQVVPIRCEALLEQHGSLHCATMQIS